MMPGMKPEELTVGRVVYDIQRGIIGKVRATYPPGEFISAENGKPVLAPVVELETGDTLVATAGVIEHWATLDPQHEPFYRDVVTAMQQVTKALCGAAAAHHIPAPLTFLMVGRAFQVQGGVLLKPDPEV